MKISIRTGLLTITIFLNIFENASGMNGDPERKPDKLIPYRYRRFIGVWKNRNGDVENLHMLPANNLRMQINGLKSYIDEIDNIRFRVYYKNETMYGAQYEPPPSAHAALMHQMGQTKPPMPSSPFQQTGPPQHQPSPPQHQPSPPQNQPRPSGQSVPYHCGGFITHDKTIFELQENPVTGNAVDIRPHGLKENWVPTTDEIIRHQIRTEHVSDYYPNSFVVYKLPDGKVIGSRLA